MKLGNISFREELAKDMSFADFQTLYSGRLKRFDLKKAYFKLGGKEGRPKEVSNTKKKEKENKGAK